MVKVETLKALYRANRKLREQNEKYLRIINRQQDLLLTVEEEALTDKDRYKGLFNFNF
jgi:hypothetical protein